MHPLLTCSAIAFVLHLAALDSAIQTQGQPASAEQRNIERLLETLEKTPRKGAVLDKVYGYHVELGTVDRLVQSYQSRVERDPKDGAAWQLLGLIELERGRDAAAAAALGWAERTRPEDPLAPYYHAQALVLVGQTDEAAKAFERSIERKPSRIDLIEVFQQLGRLHQRAGRPEQAAAAFARLEKMLPGDLRVREKVASIFEDEGQIEEALKRYQALSRDAKDPAKRIQYTLASADLKARIGKPKDAISEYESAIASLNPDDWLYRETRRKIDETFLLDNDQSDLSSYYTNWLAKNPDRETCKPESQTASQCLGVARRLRIDRPGRRPGDQP